MSTNPTANTVTDPAQLFALLQKEASDSINPQNTATPDAANNGTPADDKNKPADGQNKTASVVFDKAFFQKLGSNDAEAAEQLNGFVSDALANGHSAEEIADLVGQMEAEAMAANDDHATTTTTTDNGTPAGDGGQPANAEQEDAFEAAATKAEDEAIEKAIADEIENNPLAKAAGITRETIEAWMIGERGGEAYYHGRQQVADIVTKIASQVIPGDELVDEALKTLKEAGVDVTAIEASVVELKKEASAVPTESDAAKKAREIAQAEENVSNSLIVLKLAGFDVDELVKQAEEKKKMSGGKKALIAGAGTLGALGAGYMAKRHSGTIATKAVGAVNKLKSKMGK